MFTVRRSIFPSQRCCPAEFPWEFFPAAALGGSWGRKEGRRGGGRRGGVGGRGERWRRRGRRRRRRRIRILETTKEGGKQLFERPCDMRGGGGRGEGRRGGGGEEGDVTDDLRSPDEAIQRMTDDHSMRCEARARRSGAPRKPQYRTVLGVKKI